jgi:hypothetical protein
LREYDAVIGRWLSPDPAGQYASPYLAHGNNPVSRIDPDGGADGDPNRNSFSVGFAAYRNQARTECDCGNPFSQSLLSSFGEGFYSGLQSSLQGIKHEFTFEGTWDRVQWVINPGAMMQKTATGAYGVAGQLMEAIPAWGENDWAYAAGFAVEKVGEIWLAKKLRNLIGLGGKTLVNINCPIGKAGLGQYTSP